MSKDENPSFEINAARNKEIQDALKRRAAERGSSSKVDRNPKQGDTFGKGSGRGGCSK